MLSIKKFVRFEAVFSIVSFLFFVAVYFALAYEKSAIGVALGSVAIFIGSRFLKDQTDKDFAGKLSLIGIVAAIVAGVFKAMVI